MKKWLSIIFIVVFMISATVCLADEGQDTSGSIPNLTQEQAQHPTIKSGTPIVNLNEEPNGKQVTNVEQAVIEGTTVKSNTQGQGN